MPLGFIGSEWRIAYRHPPYGKPMPADEFERFLFQPPFEAHAFSATFLTLGA